MVGNSDHLHIQQKQHAPEMGHLELCQLFLFLEDYLCFQSLRLRQLKPPNSSTTSMISKSKGLRYALPCLRQNTDFILSQVGVCTTEHSDFMC